MQRTSNGMIFLSMRELLDKPAFVQLVGLAPSQRSSATVAVVNPARGASQRQGNAHMMLQLLEVVVSSSESAQTRQTLPSPSVPHSVSAAPRTHSPPNQGSLGRYVNLRLLL
mgnify:CR=1 FL=1